LMTRILRGPRRVRGCSVCWIGKDEPLSLVSHVLKRSGVRIERVKEDDSSIIGSIAPRKERHSCSVSVRLYPHGCISLVETVCVGSWRGPGSEVLSAYVETLNRNIEETLPVDVATIINLSSFGRDGNVGGKTRGRVAGTRR